MSTGALGPVLLASTLACAVTTAGIYLIARREPWANRNAVYFMSFAAGVLISVSFVHILPTSFEMSGAAPVFVLLGFLGLHLFNRLLHVFVCQHRQQPELTIGITPMLGIGFHSFLDGLIYSVTFNVSIFTGAVAAIGMVLHELPEGIVTFVLLELGGFKKRSAALWAFLAAGLSTPVGALVAYPFLQSIRPPALGALLALSGGALIYVGATHLLPAVERANRLHTLIALATGVLVAAAIVLAKE
jgi:zinc and cadmium transporter